MIQINLMAGAADHAGIGAGLQDRNVYEFFFGTYILNYGIEQDLKGTVSFLIWVFIDDGRQNAALQQFLRFQKQVASYD